MYGHPEHYGSASPSPGSQLRYLRRRPRLAASATHRTAPHRTAVFPHSISTRARVRRNHGRLPSNGLIERAKSTVPAGTPSRKTCVRLSTSVTRTESQTAIGGPVRWPDGSNGISIPRQEPPAAIFARRVAMVRGRRRDTLRSSRTRQRRGPRR